MHHNMDELLNWDHREDRWCFQAFRKALSVLTQAQHKPHASLHRQTSANTIHHHGIGGGTLILHTPCFRPQHVTPRRSWWGGLARWKILWHLPACCLKSSHWVEVPANSPTCCPYSSWAKCLLLFSRSLSLSLVSPQLWKLTFHSRLTSLFVWWVQVIKFPSGFSHWSWPKEAYIIHLLKTKKEEEKKNFSSLPFPSVMSAKYLISSDTS